MDTAITPKATANVAKFLLAFSERHHCHIDVGGIRKDEAGNDYVVFRLDKRVSPNDGEYAQLKDNLHKLIEASRKDFAKLNGGQIAVEKWADYNDSKGIITQHLADRQDNGRQMHQPKVFRSEGRKISAEEVRGQFQG